MRKTFGDSSTGQRPSTARIHRRPLTFKALAYLLGRGFDQIIPIIPFRGDPSVEEFGASALGPLNAVWIRPAGPINKPDASLGRTFGSRSGSHI